jgi:hypothetical protein
VVISGSDIENLDGMTGITTIGGGLEIHSNEDLENLQGLDSLEYIGGDLKVYNNAGLQSFSGLDNLEYIGADLSVTINNALADLTSLGSLAHVGDGITILNNELLSQLNGLDNIDTDALQELTIRGNTNLSFCSANSICAFIKDTTNKEDIDINNNAYGCNNTDEVEYVCDSIKVGLPELSDFNSTILCKPNPFSIKTTISYKLDKPGLVSVSFYNQLGRLVDRIDLKQSVGKNEVEWQPVDLPNGIYYFIVQTESQSANGKVVLLK